MLNIRHFSTSNIVSPGNISENSVNDKYNAIQCKICQAWRHLKYNKLNHIDYKYLQRSSDPWFCLYCCSSIFSSGFLTSIDFYIAEVCQKMFPTKTVLSI